MSEDWEQQGLEFGVQDILVVLARNEPGVRLDALREQVKVPEPIFESTLAASLATGLVTLRNRLRGDIEARITHAGRMVLEAQ